MKPAFLSVGSVHDEGTEKDSFLYSFRLQLNDADLSKPVTLRLQSGAADGGSWDNESGYTMLYGGEGAVWEAAFLYDMLPIPLETGTGLLREMRIACDYSLPDGNTGTVYSTEVGSLYSYKGEYLTPTSAQLKDGKLSAVFKVEPELILDLSKVEAVGCSLRSGSSSWELIGKAEISAIQEDGSLTVDYTLNGESLDPASENQLLLTLRYQDKDGAIDWKSSAAASFDAHIAPTMSMMFGGVVEPGSYEPGFGVNVDIKLNDLLGGKATVTMLKAGSSGFEPYAAFGSFSYAAGEEDEAGTVSFFFADDTLYDLWMNDADGRRYQAKFVMEYQYPDGSKGSLESPVFEQYGGMFARYVNSPEIRYDAESKVLTAEVALDLSLVEAENVTVLSTAAYFDTWTNLGSPSLVSSYMPGDGTCHMMFALPLETYSPGEYWYDIGLRFYNGLGPAWEQELFAVCYLD